MIIFCYKMTIRGFNREEVKDAMKKGLLFPFIFAFCFFLFGCTEEQPEKRKILAKINDYELTTKEFEGQLAADLKLGSDFNLTKEAKKEFLEQLIQKELLIQEAKRLKLDRKEKFIRIIERYWESTLIRDLMELRGKEIMGRVYVSREEIEEAYKKRKESGGDVRPLEEIQKEIGEEIKEQKKLDRLEEWLNGLRKDAEVEIDQEMLFRN